MKLKEVCELTGLSKKTIRFYEEKHLIFPEVRYQNGRNFREYSQKNVEDLLEIATLRKALFSIEEIYMMQQEPEEIADILNAHAHRTKELYDHLKFLNHTIEQIRPEEIMDVSDLAKELSGPARQLPLPSYDINPKFRYLDALEETPAVREKIDYDTSKPPQRVLNLATLSRIRGGGLIINAHYFTHFRNIMNEKPEHKAMDMPSPEPKWLWVLQTVFTAVVFLTVGVLVLYWIGFGKKRLWFMQFWVNYGTFIVWIFVITLVMKLALHGFWAWKQHNDWCKRVNSKS